VKQQAIDDMKAAKKQELLAKKVAAIRAALAAGQSPDAVAEPYGGFKEASPVTANAAFVPTLGFGPHIMPKVLKLKPGQVSDTLSTPLGVMWVRLDKRVPADPAGYASQKEQLQQEMVFNAMNEWLEKEKKTVRIEVLRADLREPKPGPYKTVTLGGS
jgi:parvulin-like peptidyl-prolyl isomerase